MPPGPEVLLMPDNTREDCPCLNLKCSRYGDCDSCESYQISRGNLPYCRRAGTQESDTPHDNPTDENSPEKNKD
jgi:hypothetical protein